MRTIGNDVYIQRGEDFTLDLSVKNEDGDPYMIFSGWTNPYLAITVTAARYEQPGDFRVTYWLDLARRWVQQVDGQLVQEPIKRFVETKAYPLSIFSVQDAVNIYGVSNGGRMVLDKNSDYDVTNYLFFTIASDGTKTYRFVKDYTFADGQVTRELWEDYEFRIFKSFKTNRWTEQRYLYDAKILAGQLVPNFVKEELLTQDIETEPLPWDEEYLADRIEQIEDDTARIEAGWAYLNGWPLMPGYDVKTLVLEPRNLYVSANIQGGIR